MGAPHMCRHDIAADHGRRCSLGMRMCWWGGTEGAVANQRVRIEVLEAWVEQAKRSVRGAGRGVALCTLVQCGALGMVQVGASALSLA